MTPDDMRARAARYATVAASHTPGPIRETFEARAALLRRVADMTEKRAGRPVIDLSTREDL